MEQIPKIARVRMAAQAAGAHPEAELLNAFAENALTIERAAGCAEPFGRLCTIVARSSAWRLKRGRRERRW